MPTLHRTKTKKMSYKNISILKFQQLVNCLNDDNDFTIWKNRISILEDMDINVIEKMKVTDFKKIVAKYKWINEEQMPTDWVKEFTINDEKFIVQLESSTWNVEQFISLSTLTKNKDEIVNNIHNILAVLCKSNEDNSITEYNRKAELFLNNLPITTAYPIALFYAASLTYLFTNTRYSFKVKKLMRKRLELAKQINGYNLNGVGTTL